MNRSLFAVVFAFTLLSGFNQSVSAQASFPDGSVSATLTAYANPSGKLFLDANGEEEYEQDFLCSNLNGNYDFQFVDSSSDYGFVDSGAFRLKCSGSSRTTSVDFELSQTAIDILYPSEGAGSASISFNPSTMFVGSNDPGFQTLTLGLTVMPTTGSGDDTDDDSTEDDSTEDTEESLFNGISSVEDPSFETIDTSTLISADADLVVNFTYKVEQGIITGLIAAGLSNGDITSSAKALAERFKVKLNLKNLKKAAQKELRRAIKGKKGEEREMALAEAQNSGLNKLLSDILVKLPKTAKELNLEGDEKAAQKKLRQAKKKQILEAVKIELTGSENATEDGKSVVCYSFKLTLPAKVCKAEDGSQTLVVAGSIFDLSFLEEGESFTYNFEAVVLGDFSDFLTDTDTSKKGVNIQIPLTITNP